jgi:hypothetical protein
MGDFIKRNDQELRAQAALAWAVVSALPAAYGQSATTMGDFDTLLTQFTASLEDHVAAQETARAKTQAKADARAALVAALRSLNAVAQAKVGVSDAQLAAAGLPVHDTTRTPGPAPTERPECRVVVVGQEHWVTVVNADTLRPTRPADARLVEVYRAAVTPGQPLPSGIDQMTLVATGTASRYRFQFDSADIGKTIVYLARYVGAKGQPGPAGTTTAASVAA